jgi:formyltetrahydrofolate deformylase
VGPNNWGVADPIVRYVTCVGACIAEIQMREHRGDLFAVHLRFQWPGTRNTLSDLRAEIAQIGRDNGLSIRAWAPDEHDRPPRLAILTTYRPEPALAVLEAIDAGRLRATPVVLIGNRPACQFVADRFGVDWHMIGDAQGNPDNERMVELFDRYQVDHIVLARYMRLIPPCTCWKFGRGRIVNLHHGLLPAFSGGEPYREAHAQRMLTYGATVHFIVPDLDASGQIIHQETFTVAPGTPLEEVIRIGPQDHEPRCLVEGLRRVLDREVELRFDKVVPVAGRATPRHPLPAARLLKKAPSNLTRASAAGGPVRLEDGRDMPSPFVRDGSRPLTMGFWLCGIGLAAVGCIVGAMMPYRHPVAVAISILWWGLYCGSFGASIGGLLGLRIGRRPARSSMDWQRRLRRQSPDRFRPATVSCHGTRNPGIQNPLEPSSLAGPLTPRSQASWPNSSPPGGRRGAAGCALGSVPSRR